MRSLISPLQPIIEHPLWHHLYYCHPRIHWVFLHLLIFCHNLRRRRRHAFDALTLRAGTIDLGGKTLTDLLCIGLTLTRALVTPAVARSPVSTTSSVASIRLGACHARLPFAFAAKGRMISTLPMIAPGGHK